jgi:hypothetical protein
MAIPVEEIVLDQGLGRIVAYAVAKALILAVVNVIVMDMVASTRDKIDTCM